MAYRQLQFRRRNLLHSSAIECSATTRTSGELWIGGPGMLARKGYKWGTTRVEGATIIALSMQDLRLMIRA